MNISNVSIARDAFAPMPLDLDGVKSIMTQFRSSLVKLGTVAAAPAGQVGNAQPLEKPKSGMLDASLRLGLLQDTLNQLMQKVTSNELKQRLNESNTANQKQLEELQESAREAAKAQAKQAEAKKKGNVFQAISNWIQAAVTVISIVITVVAAVGQAAAGNYASSAALFAAAAALGVVAGCQVALAIDDTMKAAGVEKGLGINREICEKVMEVAGYIALACSMIGMLGGMAQALSKAATTATAKVAGEAGKYATQEAVKQAVQEATKAAFKELASHLITMGKRLAVTTAMGTLASQGVAFGGKIETSKLESEASEFQFRADLKQADAESIKALIEKLQAMIEQLQKTLEENMERGEQMLNNLWQPIHDSYESMNAIMQTNSA